MTITVPKDAPKSVHKTVIEEHYTLIHEPGSNYLGHVNPKSGLATDICDALTKFLDNKTCDLVAVRCDGTVTNTGKYQDPHYLVNFTYDFILFDIL